MDGHTHPYSSLSDIPGSFNPSVHTHSEYAALSHKHKLNDISDMSNLKHAWYYIYNLDYGILQRGIPITKELPALLDHGPDYRVSFTFDYGYSMTGSYTVSYTHRKGYAEKQITFSVSSEPDSTGICSINLDLYYTLRPTDHASYIISSYVSQRAGLSFKCNQDISGDLPSNITVLQTGGTSTSTNCYCQITKRGLF